MTGFKAYRNADGSVGVRNRFLVLSLTGLTGPTARRVAQQIHGAEVITMPFGSGVIGADGVLSDRKLETGHARQGQLPGTGDRRNGPGECLIRVDVGKCSKIHQFEY